MTTFMDYFSETIEYPNIGFNILPMGINYECVSCSFLNGFINYTKPLKAFVLGRYYGWDEILSEEDSTISIMNPPCSFKWETVKCKTKNELYKKLIVPLSVYHSKLDIDFQDDVIILAKSKETVTGDWCYFYFWYDRDCSDCSIGRFTTDETKDVVIDKFIKFCNEVPCNKYGNKEIPLHYFNGWLEG